MCVGSGKWQGGRVDFIESAKEYSEQHSEEETEKKSKGNEDEDEDKGEGGRREKKPPFSQ